MKNYRFLLIAPLLVACGTGDVISSSNVSSSVAPKYTPTGVEKIDAFFESLTKLVDHPNKADVKVSTEYNYMTGGTDGEYFTMRATDEFTIERFTLPEYDGITVRTGTYTVEDESSEYVSQVYHDEVFFYLLTDYKDRSEQDTKKTTDYEASALESNLSINFSYKEMDNLSYLTKFDNDETVVGEYTLPESIPNDGEVNYKYSLISYEDGYLNQRILHDVTFVVQNGVIVSSKQVVENDLFGGTRKKVNYSVSTTEVTYTQGEYKEFDGTLFNPVKFVDTNS